MAVGRPQRDILHDKERTEGGWDWGPYYLKVHLREQSPADKQGVWAGWFGSVFDPPRS